MLYRNHDPRLYKRIAAPQTQFGDQAKKSGHSQGYVAEKYWFSPDGSIFPVEREHGDQALKIARKLELIHPEKSISDYGFKSTWQLALGLLLKNGWLRVQVYEAKTIGLNGLPEALHKKSAESASSLVLPGAKGYFFQENWPYTLQYRTTSKEFKLYGWKKMILKASLQAKLLSRQIYDREVGRFLPLKIR